MPAFSPIAFEPVAYLSNDSIPIAVLVHNANSIIQSTGVLGMKKNVANQSIGVQMLTLGGAAYTGVVTVYVTGDGGAQAIGTAGSPQGQCYHEGNGAFRYFPDQAETNFNHIMFTFVGDATAAPASVQVYTSYPQTGDAFESVASVQSIASRLDTLLEPASGSPGDYQFSADALRRTQTVLASSLTEIQESLALVLADTNELQTDWVDGGRLDNLLDNVATTSEIGAVQTTVDAILVDTGTTLPSTLAAIAGYIDTEVSDIQSRLPAALVGGRIDASIGSIQTGVDLSATMKASINAEADTALADVGLTSTVTGRIDVAVSTRLAAVDYTPLIVDGDAIGRILQTTDKLETLLEPSGAGSPADYRLTRHSLDKAAEVVLNAQRSEYLIGGSVGEAINNTELRGDRVVVRGVISSGTTTSLSTSYIEVGADDLDQFKGRIIIFDKDTLSVGLRGQATSITANDGADLPTFTVDALTIAPVAGDTFSIV